MDSIRNIISNLYIYKFQNVDSLNMKKFGKKYQAEDSPSKESDPFADDSFGQSSAASSSASSALDFDGLYDDEVEDRDDRKTRLPVFVCLACAIICVLAVLLMLFVIPSKFNLLNSRVENKTEVAKEEPAPLPPPAQKEEPLPPPPEPVAPAAKVDEIVVVEEADIVVLASPLYSWFISGFLKNAFTGCLLLRKVIRITETRRRNLF